MKNFKALKVFISVFVLTVCCLFAGCQKKIEYTAEQPIYSGRTAIEMEIQAEFSNYCKENYSAYKNFYDYCLSEFPNGVYLLKPLKAEAEQTSWSAYPLPQIYSIYKDKINNDILISESFTINYPKTNKKTHLDGETEYSIRVTIYMPLTSDFNGDELTLEFGENYNYQDGQKYVNLYIEEKCIATCFYDISPNTRKKFTYKWFLNYFKDNFVKAE